MEDREWISVNDDLPEQDGYYLTYCPPNYRTEKPWNKYGTWPQRNINLCFYRGDKKKFYLFGNCVEHITHWMSEPDKPCHH